MADEPFRLSALDVRRYDLGGAAWRGYDRARVDRFREQVAAELERLTRHAQELEQKARNFHEQLRAFRDRDRALNDALVAAQQIRTETREAAERDADLTRREAFGEAERIVREARTEAERLVREAHDETRRVADERLGEIRRLEDEAASLDRAHRTYVAQLRLLAERQLAELTATEQHTLPALRPRAALAAGAADAADRNGHAGYDPSRDGPAG